MSAEEKLPLEGVSEEEILSHWPSAVTGLLEHPEWGELSYWMGEQRGRIVVRFRYSEQDADEKSRVFFVDVAREGWVLRQISSFQSTERGLKLVKNQSFRILDSMEQKYRGAIDLLLKERQRWQAL